MKSQLYAGQVRHKRFKPAVHELNYSVFSMLVALDEREKLASSFWLFSYNRWNLISFYDKDFGDTENETLDAYVQRKLNEAGITQVPKTVLLSCYPRIFGYTFNPLSLFYCLDESGQAFAILHEVHNTFRERYTYVLPVSEHDEQSHYINQAATKQLFVSPFAHMDMRYEFRLNVPDDKQVLVIKTYDKQGLVITASYIAQQQILSAASLLKHFCLVPLLSVKVVLGIHWEAARLWFKRVPLVRHQALKNK